MATTTTTTTTTTTIVEAKSLAPVLQLAADPPYDPVGPVLGASEPLVLYIAKVPGSKDVFLTPVKPMDRTITAQDISSSIYFLHVHGPDDETIMRKPLPSSSGASSPPPSGTAVAQKRLPDVPVQQPFYQQHQQQQYSSRYAISPPPANRSRIDLVNNSLPAMPAPSPPGKAWPSMLQPAVGLNRAQKPPALSIPRKPLRKPVLASSSPSAIQNQYNVHAGNRRRPGAPGRGMPFSAPYPENDVFPTAAAFMSPITTRFISPRRETFTIPEVHELPAGKLSRSSTQTSVRRKSVPLVSVNTVSPTSPTNRDPRRGSAPLMSMLSPTASSTGPLSSPIDTSPLPSAGTGAIERKEYQFTLIRRDPATGHQCNVATIYSHAAASRFDEETFSVENTPNWMNIVMETPGYHKFNQTVGMVAPSASCADLLSPLMSAVGACSSDAGHRKFHRHLQIEFSKLGDLPPSQSKILSQDRLDFGVESGIYGRSDGEFGASQMSLLSPGLHNTHRKRSKRTGYAFRSPWDGRCEFNSANGHSTLKCKHAFGPSLLSPDSASPNQVSELRYNLPSMAAPAPPINRLQMPNNDSKISLGRTSQLSKLKNRFSRSTSSLGVFKLGSIGSTTKFSASTLDLSLGQERAGGGFSGNHSKLGKLIIENEGLKMMDLLVAANMSVWWKSYEKR